MPFGEYPLECRRARPVEAVEYRVHAAASGGAQARLRVQSIKDSLRGVQQKRSEYTVRSESPRSQQRVALSFARARAALIEPKPSPLSFARAHAAALACTDGHGRLCVECTHTRARPLAVGRWALLLQAAQGDLDAKRTSQAKLVSGGTEPRVGHRVLVSSTLHVVL